MSIILVIPVSYNSVLTVGVNHWTKPWVFHCPCKSHSDFEKLSWNSGRSIERIQKQATPNSTSITSWPALATASSSSEMVNKYLFTVCLCLCCWHITPLAVPRKWGSAWTYFSLQDKLFSSRMSTETLHQQVSSRQSVRFSRIPPGSLAALDRAVRKACRLVMDQLLLDLQPYLQALLSRSWLAQGDVISKVCTVLEHHCELYSRVRSPCREVGVYASLQPSCWSFIDKILLSLQQVYFQQYNLQRCSVGCKPVVPLVGTGLEVPNNPFLGLRWAS